MEQIKRQRRNNYSNNKKKKIELTTIEMNLETVKHFEDLSNELIYDIFEFLEFRHVYKAFFNLNTRFNNLLINSNLPIIINISSMSRFTFDHYNKNIIIPNIHRIHSLCITNRFIYYLVSSPIRILSKFVQLKTLIIENIESTYIENLCHELISLPYLSSLVIISIDYVKNQNTIYYQILRLPALRYCKLSLKGWNMNEPLPVAINEYSSIEHLVINNPGYLHELDSLLSYVPQIRHLSIHLMYEFGKKRTKICSLLLNHLRHVSLKLTYINFDEFEQIVIDLLRTVRVLHISISYDENAAYMDAKKWEQLIVNHMPNLRIFNIRYQDFANTLNNNQLLIDTQINHFASPFWIERQWFFGHLYYKSRSANRSIFYSTNPYKGKHYTLYKQSKEINSLCGHETNLKSVDHVLIQNEEELINCMHYFPNATNLTFEDSFSTTHRSIGTILNRIIPLKQLSKLVMECHHFSFIKLIELLCFTPSLHTLIFESMPCYKTDYKSIQQSETFQLVSNSNIIRNITFKRKCTLEQLQLLVALCPRLECLTINTRMKDMKPMIRFLLNINNQDTNRLFLLCFSEVSKKHFEILQTLINTEPLVGYMYKLVDWNLYLWW